jgi:hypothetical protein
MLLSGILSRPWSPLSSRPPDVDVPLPLGLGFIELPVVGDVPAVAELTAGSPVVDPRPLGAPPPCANAGMPPSTSADARAMIVSFIGKSSAGFFDKTNQPAARMFPGGITRDQRLFRPTRCAN